MRVICLVVALAAFIPLGAAASSGLSIVLSGTLSAQHASGDLTTAAQPSERPDPGHSDAGPAFGPDASRSGPPALIPLRAVQPVKAQTGALGDVQAAQTARRDVSEERADREPQMDIDPSPAPGRRQIVASSPAKGQVSGVHDIATIAPGRAVGPIAIGMRAAQAREAATRRGSEVLRSVGCLYFASANVRFRQ